MKDAATIVEYGVEIVRARSSNRKTWPSWSWSRDILVCTMRTM